MILVDTSVWIDFFRDGDAALADLLDRGDVLSHPWVIGELALGRLEVHGDEIALIGQLPAAVVATAPELLWLIKSAELGGSGIGYVDAQLVASALLTPEAIVWTRDKRLSAVCDRLGIAHHPSSPKDTDA